VASAASLGGEVHAVRYDSTAVLQDVVHHIGVACHTEYTYTLTGGAR